MAVTVKFLIFAHGNVVRGEEGASYDRDPLRKIRLKTDATYTDLLNAICTGVRIDPTAHQLKVHHRHPKSVEGRVHYSLVPILDDDDVKDLIEMAENTGEGSIQELYLEISDRSTALSEHETQQVVVTKPSTSEMPRSKRDPMTEIEDFTPKRARYEMHLSKDINNMEQEINCVLEDPIIETSKNLIVADLRNEDPSENLMIHKLHDPTAFPMPPSSISMDLANEMEDGSKSSRASSSTTPPHGKDYEVFLSFRGEDTRCGFTDHLYNGLVNAGVLAFRDDNELRVGEEIGPDLLKAIKGSRISIIIISENYASSAWCLEELVQILECRKTSRQVVLPILYKVEPSEVRNQKGNFGEGFLKSKKRHYGKESLIQKWKTALGEVTSLKVWESSKIANGHEGELSKMVVHEVLQVLNKVALPVCNHLVGVEHHVEKIIKWTSNSKQSCNAQAVLIHGMGGIGKTTLAKAVYDQLCNNFERCSFIANIGVTSQQKGLEGLQKQLILNVIGQKLHIENIDKGSDIIKARCNGKKVLMLLDDIDHRDQLNALAREPEWFGAGTVIIITSRRKDVLGMWEDSFIYELEKLNPDQSFMLFCKHAFKKSDSITDEYNSIARKIVSTTDGLPLAIEVIGSLLKGKEKSFWKENLEILKEIPHHEVQKKLKISFDPLEQEEKEIFLDIACLEIYDQQERESAFHMWNSFDFHPHVRIQNLITLSLIKSGEDGELIIHDQLRDLGREIVRQESLDDPGQRSRIWKEKDALEVLELAKGTREIQARCLYLHRMWSEDIGPDPCTSKQFKRMTKLRYLDMYRMDLEGDFEKEGAFQNLRWLNWCVGKLDFRGSNFIPKKLVVLELFKVNIIEEWKGWRQMEHLRVLKLEACKELITLPDISALKQLEVLIVKECEDLINIHPSIGKLKRLTKLELCQTGVTQLPKKIGDLCYLRSLILYCYKLKCLPNLPDSLTSLEFGDLLIKTLPDFSKLTNLEHLQFTHAFYKPKTTLNFRNLNRITTLRLKCCCIMLHYSDPGEHYMGIDCFCEEWEEIEQISEKTDLLLELPSTLVNLILKDGYTLRALPNFSDLKNLTVLSIENCPKLMEIDGLDGAESLTSVMIGSCKKLSKLGGMGISVTHLELVDLDSLESVPNLSTAKKLKNLTIRNCRNLVEIQGLDNAEGIESVAIDGCSFIERIGFLSNLKMLTTLELSNCKKLTKTLQDFSDLTNLEHLVFTHDFRRRDTTLNFRNLSRLTTLWLGCYSIKFDCSDPKSDEELEIVSDEELEIVSDEELEIMSDEELEIVSDEELEIVQSQYENIDLLLELPSTLVKLVLKDGYTLRALPNFSDFKNLTVLSIENCPKLMEIDGLDGAESLTSVMIGSCKKLSKLSGIGISVTHLELKDLDSLEILPNLSTAKELKNLIICNCRNLIEIQGLDNTECIESVAIDGCSSLERIGDLSNLKRLTTLKLCNCEKLSEIRGMGISVTHLELEHLNSLVSLPDLSSANKLEDLKIYSCGKLVQIQGLGNVQGIKSVIIDRCSSLKRIGDLSHMKMLKTLEVRYCEKILEIRGLGISLVNLKLEHLNSLVSLPDLSSAKELKDLKIHSCRNLVEIQGLGYAEGIESVKITRCSSLERVGDLSQLKLLTTLDKLVVLELFEVNIIEKWMGWSQMKHLRVLKLVGCSELITLPDISALKELEVLILKDCHKLRNIHPSIGKLKLLTKVDLSDCDQLKGLPNLPNSLTSLKFDGDLIETLPDFSNLANLEHLVFTHDFRRRDTTLNFRNLSRLTTLRLGCYCVKFDCSDPKSDEELVIVSDEKLEIVQSECENIDLLLELPSTLVNLILKDGYTLRALPNFSDLKNLTVLSIENCPKLMEIDGLDGAESLTSVMIGSCKQLSKLGGMGISVTHLELLDLDSLVSLPNLSTAKELKNLTICNCRSLIEIQGLDNAEGIESVLINGCSFIERIGDLSNLKMLTTLELCNCEKLSDIQGIEKLTSLTSLSIYECHPQIKFLDFSIRNVKSLRIKDERHKFPNHQNVRVIVEPLEEQEGGYLPDMSRFKNSNHIVEECCEISLGCLEPTRLVIRIVAEPLEEQEAEYLPDLSRLKNLNDIVEGSCEISLGCPAIGRLADHENVHFFAEPLEEHGEGYL